MRLFYLYLTLFILSLIPFFTSPPVMRSKPQSQKEHFNPDLKIINTLEKADHFLGGICRKATNQESDTLTYIKAVQLFVSEKFFHGYAEYKVRQNWIAALSGKYIWFHLSGIVMPEALMDYSEGLCNQQTMVFMELLKRKGISTRVVGLGYPTGPGHFLCEVKYNGSWHLYDVTTEPDWRFTTSPNQSIAFYKQHRYDLYTAYQRIYTKEQINKLLERIEYGGENAVPAKRMRLFHLVTYWLTIALPVAFALLAAARVKKSFKEKVKTEPVTVCVESRAL